MNALTGLDSERIDNGMHVSFLLSQVVVHRHLNNYAKVESSAQVALLFPIIQHRFSA